MDLDDTSLQTQTGQLDSSSLEVKAATVPQMQPHTAHSPLPVMPPAKMYSAQRGSSPLFEPSGIEHGGQFQDVLTYCPGNDSDGEAVEFNEPVDTLSSVKSPPPNKPKPRIVRPARNSTYSKIASDDNRSAALNRAPTTRGPPLLQEPSLTPESSPAPELSPFLDEDPKDDDFEPSRTLGKTRPRTKYARFAPLYSDDDDDEAVGGQAKRKRNRYPLMANLEIDREKYEFRLPYYFSLRRSLRGRHWTRAPVKLGTGGYVINSPLIRPMKAESIPAKQFHDKISKAKYRSINHRAKKKCHGQ
jgi:hypothetical protein